MSSVDPDGLADCNGCVCGPGSAGAGSGGVAGVSGCTAFSIAFFTVVGPDSVKPLYSVTMPSITKSAILVIEFVRVP